MRKIKVFGAAFFAVLALGAIAVATASATDEWLVGGSLVALGAKVSAVTEGSWLLRASQFFGASETHVICSGKLFGTVNGLNASGRGTDTITSIAGLKGESGTVNCEILHAVLGACTGSLLALVTAIHLPWLTEILLVGGVPRDMFASSGSGKPGFKVVCTLSNGSTASEECEGNVESGSLTNETNGTIKGEIPETKSESCTGFGAEGHVKGTGVIKALSGSIAIS